MVNSQDSRNNIFRDWIFPAIGILIAIGAWFYHQNYLYLILFLIFIFISIIFGHKYGYRFLRYTGKLKYISRVTEYIFRQVKKNNYISSKYEREINELTIILPKYSPEILCGSGDNLKEKELCRTSIACTDGYMKIHNLKEISMLFPIFAKLNYNRQWLMPVFGVKDLKNFCDEFTELTLQYWNKFALDKNTGKLKDAKYLYITWDLTNIEKWNPSTNSSDKWIKAIASLLLVILEKTYNAELIVDRLLILPDNILEETSLKNILKKITEKYFLKSDNIPKYYRINYVMENELGAFNEQEKEFIKDVCLFSNKKPSINTESRFPVFDSPDDYFYIQFSHNVNLDTKNFLYLFALDKQDDGVMNFYDNFATKIIEVGNRIRRKSIKFNKEVVNETF